MGDRWKPFFAGCSVGRFVAIGVAVNDRHSSAPPKIVPLPAPAPVKESLIGDGFQLPKEYVRGESSEQRVKTIGDWIMARGGTTKHNCDAISVSCWSQFRRDLQDKATIVLWSLRYSDASMNTYCYCFEDGEPESRSALCYSFFSGRYHRRALDTQTRSWDEHVGVQRQLGGDCLRSGSLGPCIVTCLAGHGVVTANRLQWARCRQASEQNLAWTGSLVVRPT